MGNIFKAVATIGSGPIGGIVSTGASIYSATQMDRAQGRADRLGRAQEASINRQNQITQQENARLTSEVENSRRKVTQMRARSGGGRIKGGLFDERNRATQQALLSPRLG